MTDKTDAQWQTELTPEQYKVLREHGTEMRGSSPLNNEKGPGTFRCAGCGKPLFDCRNEVRERHGMAELLGAAARGRGHQNGSQLWDDADRGALCRLRRPPWPCLPRRPPADRGALLHEWRRAQVRVEGSPLVDRLPASHSDGTLRQGCGRHRRGPGNRRSDVPPLCRRGRSGHRRRGRRSSCAQVAGELPSAHAVLADVAVEADVRRTVDEALRVYGRIDLFCSNAGIFTAGGEEVSDDDWERIWHINVLAHVYAARAVVPAMLAARRRLPPADGVRGRAADADRFGAVLRDEARGGRLRRMARDYSW